MANSRSALKRVRQAQKRTAHNRNLKDRVKDSRKSALAAIDAKDAKGAQQAYQELSSAADKAAKGGAMHKNTASRIKSRVATKINALSS